MLKIDKSFYAEDISVSNRLWVENDNIEAVYTRNPRIGINYAGSWKDKPWRYTLVNSSKK